MAKIIKIMELDLTPSDLANAFCNMDSYEQAEFFYIVGNVFKSWDSSQSENQISDIVNSLLSNPNFSTIGVGFIMTLHEYLMNK